MKTLVIENLSPQTLSVILDILAALESNSVIEKTPVIIGDSLSEDDKALYINAELPE